MNRGSIAKAALRRIDSPLKDPNMALATHIPSVAVLISTYNGEAYLSAQLDSLALQKSVNVEVFVRDDGSTDKTIEILRDYAHRWPALGAIVSGKNLRPATSFLTLLADVPDNFDYYAFCDQDDVWLPEKLSYATEKLSVLPDMEPGLYCAEVTCVDHNLTPLGQTSIRGTGRFDELIFANIVSGNTLVMNNAAAMLVRSRTPEHAVIMHDWWCALVVSAFGRVVCDARPTVLYRQHQGNALGAAPGRIPGLLFQLKVFLRDPRGFYPIRAQTAELLRLYGDGLRPTDRKLAGALVDSCRSSTARILYAIFGRIPRSDLFGSLGTRILIAVGWY